MYFIFLDIALEIMAALVPMSTSANGNGLLLYPHKTNVFEGYSGITLSVRPSLRQFLCPILYKILQFRWPLVIALFLAHLSTTCSRGAFRITLCPSSVVHCLSCIVNNFLKHQLLNCWANLNQTWQECSLGGPLKNY